MTEPQRICSSCGCKKPKLSLQRFVWKNGQVVSDPGQILPGRGAYCCENEQCRRLLLGGKKKWKRLFRL